MMNHNPTADLQTVNLSQDGRPQYRLGDAVLKRNEAYGQTAFDEVVDHPEVFAGSLLCDYADVIDRASSDPQWSILKVVLDDKVRRDALKLPQEDELVVHLRLGNSKGFEGLASSLVEYTVAVIKDIQEPINRITLVCAIHFGISHIRKHAGNDQVSNEIDQNVELVSRVLTTLHEQGIAAQLRSSLDIDADFAYLANASHLVLGNGHFALCAAMVSQAQCYVPPWALSGMEADTLDLIGRRPELVGSRRVE